MGAYGPGDVPPSVAARKRAKAKREHKPPGPPNFPKAVPKKPGDLTGKPPAYQPPERSTKDTKSDVELVRKPAQQHYRDQPLATRRRLLAEARSAPHPTAQQQAIVAEHGARSRYMRSPEGQLRALRPAIGAVVAGTGHVTSTLEAPPHEGLAGKVAKILTDLTGDVGHYIGNRPVAGMDKRQPGGGMTVGEGLKTIDTAVRPLTKPAGHVLGQGLRAAGQQREKYAVQRGEAVSGGNNDLTSTALKAAGATLEGFGQAPVGSTLATLKDVPGAAAGVVLFPADVALGTISGGLHGHPEQGIKAAGDMIARTYVDNYGPLYRNDRHAYEEFVHRVKEGGYLQQALDASVLAGVGISGVARTLGKGIKRNKVLRAAYVSAKQATDDRVSGLKKFHNYLSDRNEDVRDTRPASEEQPLHRLHNDDFLHRTDPETGEYAGAVPEKYALSEAENEQVKKALPPDGPPQPGNDFPVLSKQFLYRVASGERPNIRKTWGGSSSRQRTTGNPARDLPKQRRDVKREQARERNLLASIYHPEHALERPLDLLAASYEVTPRGRGGNVPFLGQFLDTHEKAARSDVSERSSNATWRNVHMQDEVKKQLASIVRPLSKTERRAMLDVANGLFSDDPAVQVRVLDQRIQHVIEHRDRLRSDGRFKGKRNPIPRLLQHMSDELPKLEQLREDIFAGKDINPHRVQDAALALADLTTKFSKPLDYRAKTTSPTELLRTRVQRRYAHVALELPKTDTSLRREGAQYHEDTGQLIEPPLAGRAKPIETPTVAKGEFQGDQIPEAARRPVPAEGVGVEKPTFKSIARHVRKESQKLKPAKAAVERAAEEKSALSLMSEIVADRRKIERLTDSERKLLDKYEFDYKSLRGQEVDIAAVKEGRKKTGPVRDRERAITELERELKGLLDEERAARQGFARAEHRRGYSEGEAHARIEALERRQRGMQARRDSKAVARFDELWGKGRYAEAAAHAADKGLEIRDLVGSVEELAAEHTTRLARVKEIQKQLDAHARQQQKDQVKQPPAKTAFEKMLSKLTSARLLQLRDKLYADLRHTNSGKQRERLQSSVALVEQWLEYRTETAREHPELRDAIEQWLTSHPYYQGSVRQGLERFGNWDNASDASGRGPIYDAIRKGKIDKDTVNSEFKRALRQPAIEGAKLRMIIREARGSMKVLREDIQQGRYSPEQQAKAEQRLPQLAQEIADANERLEALGEGMSDFDKSKLTNERDRLLHEIDDAEAKAAPPERAPKSDIQKQAERYTGVAAQRKAVQRRAESKIAKRAIGAVRDEQRATQAKLADAADALAQTIRDEVIARQEALANERRGLRETLTEQAGPAVRARLKQATDDLNVIQTRIEGTGTRLALQDLLFKEAKGNRARKLRNTKEGETLGLIGPQRPSPTRDMIESQAAHILRVEAEALKRGMYSALVDTKTPQATSLAGYRAAYENSWQNWQRRRDRLEASIDRVRNVREQSLKVANEATDPAVRDAALSNAKLYEFEQQVLQDRLDHVGVGPVIEPPRLHEGVKRGVAPFYVPDEEFLRRHEPGLHKVVGNAPGNLKTWTGELYLRGERVRNPMIIFRGIQRNIRDEFAIQLLTDLMERHGVGPKNRTREEMVDWARAHGFKEGSYKIVSTGYAVEKLRLQQAGLGRDQALHNFLDDSALLDAIEESVVGGKQQPEGIFADMFRKTSDFQVMDAVAYDEMVKLIRGSSRTGRVYDIFKGFQSRALLLAFNIPWLASQIIANSGQMLAGGAHPGDLVSFLQFQKKMEATPHGKRRWAATMPLLGMEHLSFDLTTPHLASKVNGGFWEAWYGFKDWRELQPPIKQMMMRPIHTTLEAQRNVDRWYANTARGAVFYRELRKQAKRNARMDNNVQGWTNKMEDLFQRVGRPGKTRRQQEAWMIKLLQNQPAVEDIARHVNDFMGDYAHMSAFERQRVGRMFMFYGYLRFSLRFALWTMPTKHPIISSLLVNLGNMEADEMRKLLQSDDMLPFQLGNFFFHDKNGQLQEIRLNNVNPALNQVMPPQWPASALGWAPPVVLAMIDQLFGASAFKGGVPWKVGGETYPQAGETFNVPTRLKVLMRQLGNSVPAVRFTDKIVTKGRPQASDSLPLLGMEVNPQYKDPEKVAAMRKVEQHAKDVGTGGLLKETLLPFLPHPSDAIEQLDRRKKAEAKRKRKKTSSVDSTLPGLPPLPSLPKLP